MNKDKTFAPRFLALILDTVLLLPLAIAADALTDSPFSENQRLAFLAIVNLANVIYFVILHGLYGQTVGKYLMKVKVVALNGSPIGFKRAVLRDLLQIILVGASLIPVLNINLGETPDEPVTPVLILMSIWGLADVIVYLLNPAGRALHDLIAGTIVVRLDEDTQVNNSFSKS